MDITFDINGGDFTAAGEAATKVKKILRKVGIDASIIRKVAIVAYEMEMNLVIHSNSGTLKVELTPEEVVLISEDNGPGIENVGLAMQVGYSTAPESIREMGFGAGMGLPNIRRCSDDFTIKSTVGEGTHVRSVIHL